MEVQILPHYTGEGRRVFLCDFDNIYKIGLIE